MVCSIGFRTRSVADEFLTGHVLTRIICKGSAALGIIGEHARELEVLDALLAQKRWRRGQRGRWHERRALILSTHFPKDDKTTEQALDVVIEALKDPDTHIGKICNVGGLRVLKMLSLPAEASKASQEARK